MLKTVCFGIFLFGFALATDIQRFDNVIEYNEPLRGVSFPYPYLDNPSERVVVKPLYSDVVLPATAIGASKLGLLIAKVASTAIAVVKKTFVFIIANAPALIIGTVAAIGLCKFTPICDKLDSFKSLLAVPLELRSYATPERIARASEFVKTAIRKYRSFQN